MDNLKERLRKFEKWLYAMDLAGLSEEQPNLNIVADRIAALEADNARLLGLVKEAREHVAHMAEEYQRDSTWDLLERIDAILAKIKETPDA